MEQATTDNPLIGAQVGNYLIRTKLGEGGMGAVYLAEHPRIGKKVALKVLHAEFSANQDITNRFFNEARAVNDIGHPNIVDVIDYGVIPAGGGQAGMVYFIMELLRGSSLAQVIHNESAIPHQRALAIALQIADALSASHRHRIVHRDLKPDNVILLDRGATRDFVKVLDFGIAKLTGDQPGSRRTRTGIVMGTPAYMSPEQCEGKGAVNHRTDVYSLGIVLYEMLTGLVPFQGEGYGEVLVQHLTAVPVRPTTIRPTIPPHVEAVCLKALEKRPDLRYASMDAFIEALRDPVAYVDGHGGLASFFSPNLGAPGWNTAPMPFVPMATPPPMVVPPAAGTSPLAASPPVAAAAAHGASAPAHRAGSVESLSPAGPSKRRLASIGAVVVAAIGVVVAVMLAGGDDAPPSKPSSAAVGETQIPAVAPPAVSPPAPAVRPVAPSTVTIRVTSRPPGAEVVRDGKVVGTTPAALIVPQSDDDLELLLTHDGYEQQRAVTVPNKDRALSLSLEAVAAPAKTARTPAAVTQRTPTAKVRPVAKPTRPAKPAKRPASGVGNNTLEPDF